MKNTNSFSKRALSLLLSVLMMVSVISVGTIQASAYTTPGNVSVSTIGAKADQLLNELGGEGAFFNCYQDTSCGIFTPNSNHGPKDGPCDITVMISKIWFQNKFGISSVSQLPAANGCDGSHIDKGGYSASCRGFARFALWYLFKTKDTDEVNIKTIAANALFNKSSFDSYAKPGDMIAMGDYSDAHHWAIYLSHDSSGITVIDCNSMGTYHCEVHKRTYSYGSYSYIGIARATNAVESVTESSSTLRNRLKSTTSETIYDFCYDDFDGDGIYEAFAATSAKSGNNIDLDEYNAKINVWFINNNSAKKIKSSFFGVILQANGSNYKFIEKYQYNKSKFVVVNQWAQTGRPSLFWYVKNSQCVYDSKASGTLWGFHYNNDFGWFEGSHSTFDLGTDGTGHTYKLYYYYFDDGLKEYGGISISESQLTKIANGSAIISEVKKHGTIRKIIARANGIININYRYDDHNYNLSLLYRNNKLSYFRIYDDVNAFDAAVDEGVYQTACIPDLAIYPSGIIQYTDRSHANTEFPDVKGVAWYYDAVKYNAQKGYIMGFKNGNFGPSENLKRQDFVVILARIADADLSKYQNKTSKLKDVKKGAYYAAAVNWAVDNGIITGYANGNFGVNDNITREQVATILYRYMGEPSVSGANSTLSKFNDSGRISSFAKKPVAWAVQNNIISGMADGRVAPTEGASRAQIASIIMRMDQKGMF